MNLTARDWATINSALPKPLPFKDTGYNKGYNKALRECAERLHALQRPEVCNCELVTLQRNGPRAAA